MRPHTDIRTIASRQELVQKLLNFRGFGAIATTLKTFPDMDKMISGLVNVPKKITQRTAKIGIDTLIYIKQAIKQSSILAEILSEMQSSVQASDHLSNFGDDEPNPEELLIAILKNLRDKNLSLMEKSVTKIISESTSFSRSPEEMKHQECFAIKAGLHGMLDVSRKTFLQTIEDIYAVSYTEQH